MGGNEVQTIGVSLIHWLDSFERIYGPERSRALRGRLPEDVAAAVDRGLDPKAWYPLAWYRAMLVTGCEVSGEGREMVGRVARTSARAEFSGIHRILLLFVSPQRLLRTAARLFERYYSHGTLTTGPSGPKAAEARWSGCREFEQNVWHDVWHATAVVIELCGGRDVTWEVLGGGGQTDEHATVLYRWQ